MMNLKKMRENMGLTQVQIAMMSDISERGYQKIESGEQLPNVITAQKIAKALKTSIEVIFNEENESKFIEQKSKAIKKLYDVDEFYSEILERKVSRSTIYNKIKTGDIASIKIGKKPLIPAWFVEELLCKPTIKL